jgi:hypothetical protein
MPVLAVTETASGFFACLFLSAMMMALRSKDFPVPARTASIQTLIGMDEIETLRGTERRGTYLLSQ